MSKSKLSFGGQVLVDAARSVWLPSDADRERVFETLRASLGNAVLYAMYASGPHEVRPTKGKNAA